MNAAENQKLRELYRTIEAEGGAAAPDDLFSQGINYGVEAALRHLEAAGFWYSISPLDLVDNKELAA